MGDMIDGETILRAATARLTAAYEADAIVVQFNMNQNTFDALVRDYELVVGQGEPLMLGSIPVRIVESMEDGDIDQVLGRFKVLRPSAFRYIDGIG